MSDIISARCFGCGNVIKVPAGLGGKKARCPQCTNTITIPMPNDTQMDEIIPDTDLPEVAREGEPVVPEEGDAPIPGIETEEAPKDPSEVRRKGGTSVRGRGTAATSSNPRVQRSGTQPRYSPPPKAAPKPSNTGMMIGIGLGAVALVILAVVLAGGKSQGKTPVKIPTKEKERERESAVRNQPQYSPEEQALVSRAMDYTSAVNRGDVALVMKFCVYEPEEERKFRIRTTEMLDKKPQYDNVKIVSVSTSSGAVTFTYGTGTTKSLQWKQVDGAWMLAEPPSP